MLSLIRESPLVHLRPVVHRHRCPPRLGHPLSIAATLIESDAHKEPWVLGWCWLVSRGKWLGLVVMVVVVSSVGGQLWGVVIGRGVGCLIP